MKNAIINVLLILLLVFLAFLITTFSKTIRSPFAANETTYLINGLPLAYSFNIPDISHPDPRIEIEPPFIPNEEYEASKNNYYLDIFLNFLILGAIFEVGKFIYKRKFYKN